MLRAHEKVTLFGRFRLAARAEIERLLADRGATTVRDLTRQTTFLVIGAGATNLIPGDRLALRLAEARTRGLRVVSEARLLAMLADETPPPTTLEVRTVAPIEDGLTDLLGAFDLIVLDDGKVRFEDADTIRTAAALAADDMEPAAIIDSLLRRRNAPRGRHRLVTDATGQAVLKWEDGTSTLSGQFMLPLDESDTVETLFEEALDAEAAGDLATAARLYDTCARADRKDPIAPFNLGNVQAAQGQAQAARLSYERALARDTRFAEAHFNLAGLLERQGKIEAAADHLKRAVDADPDFSDPLFNLAQLERASGDLRMAEELFRRFLLRTPDSPLAPKAERALTLIDLQRKESGTHS